MNYQGKKPVYHLYDFFDNELREDQLYKREFSEHCIECASNLYVMDVQEDLAVNNVFDNEKKEVSNSIS